MIILVIIYLILYFLYVYFGPHFIRRFLKNDKLLIAENCSEIIKRMFFLSYITYLYNAFYFYNPTTESFLNAILINVFANIGYIIKWYHLKDSDPYYITGIIAHCLTFLPILLSVFFIKLPNSFNFGLQSKFTLFFILIYILIVNIVYE